MSHALWIAVAGFLIADVVVFAFIVRQRLSSSGFKFSTLRGIARDVHDKVGAYAPGNYSGRLEDLPQLIDALLPMAAQAAVDRGQVLDPPTLELLVATSLIAHHVASRAEVDAAVNELHARRGTQRAA